MSKQYDNTNRGALFKNDKEGGNPNWPDYRGSINVGGVDYWIDAWIKEGKTGKFMSLSVKPKEDRQRQDRTRDNAPPARGRQSAPAASADAFEDDDIPF